MASRHFQNKARRSYWSVHVEGWRKSALTRTEYCRQHGLTKSTFDRWLKALEGAEAVRVQALADAQDASAAARESAPLLCR